MRIFVKALPVHDIIKDISKQWKVPIKEDSGELTIELPEKLGKGFIRGTSFDSGLQIIEYSCTFSIDYEIVFSIKDTHPLKFIFCSEGTAAHTFEEDHIIHTIHTFQNIIVSSSGNNGHLLNFKANEKTHVTSIEIIREKFSNRNKHHFKGLDPVLKRLFEDSVAEQKFYYHGNYSIKAADIVEEINEKELSGFLRILFLESKLLEMLVLQIDQYLDDQEEDRLPKIIRRSEIEKVNRASNIIKNDLEKNHSVDSLAKEVGTNINKLQEGFKYMYNLTVNKYMQQVKLEAARDLLTSEDYNISEIVQKIGLNNRSYFSKVFKEKYGVSPKYFLKSYQDKEEDEEEDELSQSAREK